jgi:hypothetical protein
MPRYELFVQLHASTVDRNAVPTLNILVRRRFTTFAILP